MPDPVPGEVTRLLQALQAGSATARDELVEQVYRHLRRMAGRLMSQERADHSLQPTALLHEAWVQIFQGDVLQICQGDVLHKAPNRAFLYGAAAKAMHQVLARHARRRRAQKRGRGRRRVPLDAVLDYYEAQHVDVRDLHAALEELATFAERPSQVVTLRFLGGFTVAEVAQQLEVSVATVESDWRIARAWLRRRLGAGLEERA
jgi:RNA polymerase sigma factor (TIGR02999 family)